MTQKIVSRDEWLDARKIFLKKEKEFNKIRDQLSAERRALPMVKIDKDYRFITNDGEKSLSDLFGKNSQLIVYHFMYGPDWDEGCPRCSHIADNFNGIDVHLNARDTSFLAISNASLDKLNAYKKRLGWSFNWASAVNTDFGVDFNVTFPGKKSANGRGYNYTDKIMADELSGLSVFKKLDDGTICHTYSTYARGLDMLMGSYHFLDLTPKGRDEADQKPSPMAWIRRNDSYDDHYID